MIKVNLLPRELRKKKRVPFFDKYFLYVFVCFIVAIGVLWFQTIQQQTEIETLQAEISRVEAEIQRYSQQVKMIEQVQELKDKIQMRISAIQSLELERPFWVKIFEEFGGLIPEFLWIDQFTEVEKIVTIKGTSYNLKGVANFIVGLIHSTYTDDVKLNFIREKSSTAEGVTQFGFDLSTKLVVTSAGKYAGAFVEDDIEDEVKEPSVSAKVVPLGREALAVEQERTLDAVKNIKPEGPSN